jgi:hypothetical protein
LVLWCRWLGHDAAPHGLALLGDAGLTYFERLNLTLLL